MVMLLQGYRVIDWTQWQAGPGASMILGDLGAEVIKIEDCISGDPARGVVHHDGLKLGANEKIKVKDAYFQCNNRNKKGITLNLRDERGKAILNRLIEKSDVFITNFRESAALKYGLDYETLSQVNPKLVYAILTGYGPKGPESNSRSYDGVAQARSGIMFACDPSQPRYINGGIADASAATMTAFGIVSALLARERQGIGQKVETSILSSIVFQQWVRLGFQFIGNEEFAPIARETAANPLMNWYRCADSKWIMLYHPEPDRFWPNICRAMGLEEIQNDPRFNNMWKRRENNIECINIIDKAFAARTCEEWLKILQDNECIYTKVCKLEDLLTDPQVLANNYLPEFDHPSYGKIHYAPLPFNLSKTPGSLRLPAPEFGQHTGEVLAEILGYTLDEIDKLKEDKVI